MLMLADYRSQAKGLADLQCYAGLVAPGVVLNKDGSFTAAWSCAGQDTDSADKHELNHIAFQFNQTAKLLGTGWMLHMDAIRSPQETYPAPALSHFPDPTTRLIEDQRRKLFSSGYCYATKTVLCLTYKPDYYTSKITSKAQTVKGVQNILEKGLDRFQNTLVEVEELLSSVMIEMIRLTEYVSVDIADRQYIQSDLLSHLQQCLTGVLQPVRVPPVPMYLDAVLGSEELLGGTEPKLGDKYLAVLSMDGLPQESWPTMLACLETLSMSYRWSTRFIFLDQFDAKKEAEGHRKGWNQQVYRFFDKFFNNPNARANRDAALMVEDAEEAITDIQGGSVSAGYISNCIVLMAPEPERLLDQARELRRMIRSQGFGCRIESINALEAWLGTHPGNSFANLRRSMVHTLNLAHLLPLSSIWRGKPYNPCPLYPQNSPPLAVVTTDGSTPFWLNLHVGDLGHTLIMGPTGSGKSTLLAFLVAQFRRYRDAQIFCFDKGMSMFPLCMAAKGIHYDIGVEDSLAFAPLQHIDSATERAWASDWITTLLRLQNVTILPAHTNSINEGLERLAGNPENMRGLKEFWNLVPDAEIKEALRHYTSMGDMGHLMDARTDSLGLSSFTVFEIEELMNMGEKNLLPVLTYIFRRIEKALDGRPSLMTLDEAWVMLGHRVFKDKIREWLKVFRKKNCGVVLATQSLSDAKQSGILDVLAESCLTKILLANTAALQEDQSALYRDIGCNTRVINDLARATAKRDYFVMSPEGKRFIQLALSKVELSFLGASDAESIARIKELHRQHGPDGWQKHWLMEKMS